MAALYFGVALLVLAAVLFLAGLEIPAAVCCGAGGVWMSILLEIS